MANETSSSAPGGIPGSGSGFDFKTMFDAMEQARRSWSSSFSLPEAMTPTVDPQELDKRIADLRTVEQWLVLNLNLLRGSIQSLELQRAAVQSFRNLGQAAERAAGSGDYAGFDPAAWWQRLQQQFTQVAESALASSSAAMAAGAPQGPDAARKDTRSAARPARSGRSTKASSGRSSAKARARNAPG